MPKTNANQSLQLTTPLGTDKLVATGLTGTEYLSAPFEFVLNAVATADGLDPAKVSGKSVTATLIDGDGKNRFINGLATRVAITGKQWSLDLRPWLWMLTLGSDNRIFQNKTVPEILKAVFDGAGFSDYSDKLTASYAAREYCVQYNETNFAFVHRLMEEEGIWYRFEHADGKHTLVLGDDASAHVACSEVSSAKFLELPAEKNWLENNRVESATIELSVVTGKYQTDDFNFESPSTELKTQVRGAGSDQQVYAYPGGYAKKDAGESFASKRLQALEAQTKILTAKSDVRHFAAGCKFALTGHPDTALNIDWVLTEVRHDAAPSQYANVFAAIPADVAFRPLPHTPKPHIAGSQTAIVTGKAGEEIWTDKYGRIKVQFHWDQLGKKDENTTCWIRVAQSWAGKSWGAWTLPRIGQEVVVSFLDGDPDRPLVTGCVYNGDNSLPYALPDSQTRTTLKSNSSKNGAGYNEIRFEDKTDAEEIFVHARKDLNIEAEKGNRAVTVMEGNDSLTVSKGNRATTISEGNETHAVSKGTREITVKGNETHTDEADYSHEVKGNYTLKVTGDLTIQVSGKIAIQSSADVTVKAGTSLTAQSGTGLAAKAGTSATLQGGTTVEVKGAASGTVDGGGMLTVKAGMVKIN